MQTKRYKVKYAAEDCKVQRGCEIILHDFDREHLSAKAATIDDPKGENITFDLQIANLGAPLGKHYLTGHFDLFQVKFTPLPDDSGTYTFLIGEITPMGLQEDENDMFGAEEG